MTDKSYTSDSMNFINTLLNKPGNHEQQMKLRSTWWDRDFVDQNEQQNNEDSKLKPQAYVYFSYPTNK